MLERGNSAFISILKNKALHASYDLWHAHLGHVRHSVISLLNKNGHLYLTSLLPSPSLCDTCQIAKNHRLPYSCNERRSSHVLDLIHCDIWGPSPVKSTSGFICCVIHWWLFPVYLALPFEIKIWILWRLYSLHSPQ